LRPQNLGGWNKLIGVAILRLGSEPALNKVEGTGRHPTILISNSRIPPIFLTCNNKRLVVLLTNQKDYEHCTIRHSDAGIIFTFSLFTCPVPAPQGCEQKFVLRTP